jgi:hypothetical protein
MGRVDAGVNGQLSEIAAIGVDRKYPHFHLYRKQDNFIAVRRPVGKVVVVRCCQDRLVSAIRVDYTYAPHCSQYRNAESNFIAA